MKSAARRQVGLLLIVGTIASVAWFAFCPRYAPQGETYTVTVQEDGWGIRKKVLPYYRIDVGLFFAVDSIIWTGITGVWLLKKPPSE